MFTSLRKKVHKIAATNEAESETETFLTNRTTFVKEIRKGERDKRGRNGKGPEVEKK